MIDIPSQTAVNYLAEGIAILTKDGDLYLPISDKMPDYDQREKLMPFVGKYVRVNGNRV